jgi:hypothetical protein
MRKKDKAGIIFFWIILVILFGSSCGLTDNISNLIPDSEEVSDKEGITADEESSGREAMAFVVDPDYNPVAYATIGTSELLTDRNGVAIGEIIPNKAGWVLVQALGYVSNYAKPSMFSGEYDLYFVTLVPVQAGVFYEKSSPTKVWLGDSETPQIQIEIAPGSLQTDQTILELTEINPRQISMDDFWGDLDDTFTPLISFEINAYDISGVPVGLTENNFATVSIHDEENDIDDLVLQSFDPESGTWITQEEACSRVDEGTIECSLPHFSFHSYQKKYFDSEDMGSEEFGAFKNTYNEITKMFKEGGENSEDLQEAMERLAEAAKEFAKKNRNETGKAMLMYATDVIGGSGVEGSEALAQELKQEAQDLVVEMAEKLTENANCGNMYELFNLQKQAMLVGGSAEAQVQKLQDKVSDKFNNCEIWVGTIEYKFVLLNTFPGLEEWKVEDKQNWGEIHNVTIGINPMTKHLDGDSYVKLNFSTASYLTEVGGGDCGPDKEYLDINTGAGNGFTWLTFEGTYDGKTFQLEPMEERESEPVELSLHTHGSFGCPKTEKDLGKIPMLPYRSQLLDGFYGQPQPPSLEEMLNTGIRRPSHGSEVIRGSELIYYSSGVNRPEIIPVKKAWLRWFFIRQVLTKQD